MEKTVDDSSHGFFFAAVLNALIRCQGFCELVCPFESHCLCPAYKLALQGHSEVIALKEFLDLDEVIPELNWFLTKLLNVNHNCIEHRNLPCLEKCIFHAFFCLNANSRFTCKFGHAYETMTRDDYLPIFELEPSKYFPILPPTVKAALKPSDSLICPYSGKIISLYTSFAKSHCLTCNQDSCTESIFLDNPPKTLIFTLKPLKSLKDLDNLRIFSSFPTSFNSIELFTSSTSCNYSLVSYVLKNKENFMSLSYSPQKKLWIFASAGDKSEDSLFDSIDKCVIDGFAIVAVMYSENSYSCPGLNDPMWLHIENKVINRYTLGGRATGVLKRPYLNRYWTCAGCKELNFGVKICRCLTRFTVKQLGWPCLCLKRSVEARCDCGVILTKCFGCNVNYVKSKNSSWPLRCSTCEKWLCVICKKENILFYPICSFCFNPHMNFVDDLKKFRNV